MSSQERPVIPESVRAAVSAWEAHAMVDRIERYAVGALVRKGQAILIMQRRADDFLPNVFEIPGGGVEAGEDVLDALARELREETGMTLAEVQQVAGGFDYVNEDGQRVRQLNFVVETIEPDVVNHPEHQAVAWIDATTLEMFPFSAEMGAVVRSALRSQG